VFNKYAKDESRHKGAVIPTILTAHHHAFNSGSKNVISNKDWMDRMNMDMPSDDTDGEEDEEEVEEDEVDSDEEVDDETPTTAVAVVDAVVAASKKDGKKDGKKDIIDIDDI
jgi:hypothetical protein